MQSRRQQTGCSLQSRELCIQQYTPFYYADSPWYPIYISHSFAKIEYSIIQLRNSANSKIYNTWPRVVANSAKATNVKPEGVINVVIYFTIVFGQLGDFNSAAASCLLTRVVALSRDTDGYCTEHETKNTNCPTIDLGRPPDSC